MTTLAGRRVLVTGAGGFIGSHLVEALVAQGALVRAFVHYNGRNDWGNLEHVPPEVRTSVEITAGEVQDPFSVARAVAGQEIVFHLAALIGIPYSYVAPRSYVDTNVIGTVNVLEAARNMGVQRVVHTSTSETYGTARYTPIDEDHPLQGQSPYSASKIGADKMAESYHRSFDLDVTTLRPFNTFGPRQSLRAVIPTIVGQALTSPAIRLGSLTPIRDFTFVTDTAQAFISTALAPDAPGQTFNAGTGTAVSIGELVDLIQGIARTSVPVIPDPERVRPHASEVHELLCDASKLQDATGWRPLVSLREGIEQTVDWMRQTLSSGKVELYTV